MYIVFLLGEYFVKNSNYTMDDIAQFIADYKESNIYNSKEWMINIPIIGSKLYERVTLENMKRTIFESEYNKAKNGSIDQQNKFISEMTPVLDDFYNKQKRKTKINR